MMSKPLNKRLARVRGKPTPDAKDALQRVEVLTRMARNTWLAVLSYFAFVGVTLLGVKDADFFLTERETALPLIGVTIPTNLFFYIAPVLGGLLYIHLHLYLLKLWKALAEVPQNGAPQGEIIAPWIVSDMALAMRPGATHAYPLRQFTVFVAFVSIFVGGPFILGAFMLRSLPKHDALLTLVFCGLPFFLSILTGVQSWRALKQGGNVSPKLGWQQVGGWGGLAALLGAGGYAGTLGISGTNVPFLPYPANLAGVVFVETPPDWLPRAEAEQVYRAQWCKAKGIPPLACGLGPLAPNEDGTELPEAQGPRKKWCDDTAILSHAAADCETIFVKLDQEYSDAWKTERKRALARLPKRDLRGKNFRNANLFAARMEGANLREARMEGANLNEARMEGANLREARMEGANLIIARMEGANLGEARMEGAVLSEARMEGAVLNMARMDENTSLTAADVTLAAVREVDYTHVRFSADQIKSMFGDASVRLPEGIEKPDHWPDWELPWVGEHAFVEEWRKWQANPENYVPPPKPKD